MFASRKYFHYIFMSIHSFLVVALLAITRAGFIFKYLSWKKLILIIILKTVDVPSVLFLEYLPTNEILVL